MGEDPDREGLRRTPERVARAYKYMFRGYRLSPAEITRRAIFQQESNNMIILRDIELFSMCEHHILPFFGRCHVAYISRGKVVGVSKIARLVDCFSRRLQIQERLTGQIARAPTVPNDRCPDSPKTCTVIRRAQAKARGHRSHSLGRTRPTPRRAGRSRVAVFFQ